MGGLLALIWAEKATPTVPAAIGGTASVGVVVITGEPADATTTFNAWLTSPRFVVAWMVTGNVPNRVGVPAIWPLPATKINPAGKVPVSAKADGGVGNDVIWYGVTGPTFWV